MRPALVVAILGALFGAAAPAGAVDDGWVPATGGSFVAMEPSRVLDTRRAGEGPCVSGARVVEVPEVPADAGGVVLNVTVTGASAPGFVTVHAAGATRPATSSLNFSRGETQENSVVSRRGGDGIVVFASGGCPQVIVDVVGYFTGGRPARGGSFSGVEPTRLVDTRRAGQGPCVAGERVVAVPDVPADAGGAVLNVTVTGASSPGYVSAYAAGSAHPSTSSVNFVAGRTVANGVVSAVGADGLAVFASGGCPHVIVDLVGWFTGEAPVLEGSFVSRSPTRLVDTRRSGEGPCVSGERVVPVPGVPDGVTAVALNVTVTGARSPGYVSVFADGAARPGTSTLNFTAGRTTANGATTAVGPDGIRVFASGGCPHVIIDLVGHYSGEPAPLADVVQVSGDSLHTCALIQDGTVRCWGMDGAPDYSGQLGDGRAESSAFPVPVSGIDDAVQIDSSILTSCALKADKTVSCWGADPVDINGSPPMLVATPVPALSSVEQVVVGQFSICALMGDGSVKCSGQSWFNGRADEDLTEPATVPGLTDVVELTAGEAHTCARHGDGTVSCWGANFNPADPGPPYDPAFPMHVKVDGIDDAEAIWAGGMTTCASRSDASIWCWGLTDRLFDPEATWNWSEDPVAVPALAGSVTLDIGGWAVCGIAPAGQVECAGSGPVVPRDPLDDPAAAVQVPELPGAQLLAVGPLHACALLSDTTVRCWGSNLPGSLGDGSVTDSSVPVTVIAGIRPL